MFLSCILHPDGRPAIILRQGREAAFLKAAPQDLDLLLGTPAAGPLAQGILRHRLGDPVDVDDLAVQGRLALPIWGGGALHLLPVAGELPLPLVQVCPGQPVPTAPGATLEGGIAALILPGGAGQVVGWVQFHLVTCPGLGQRHLSFGPEMVLGADPPAGGGTGLLAATDGTQRSFPLPGAQAARGQDGLSPVQTGDPRALVLRRLSRWVIRPASAQGLCALESRHLGAGLALTTPLRWAPRTARDPAPDFGPHAARA